MNILRCGLSLLFLAIISQSGHAIDTLLLSDDFNDAVLDSSKWTIIKDTGSGFDEANAGSTLTESGGTMNISQVASNSGGAYKSCLLPVDEVGVIVISRTTKVHYANLYVSMTENLVSESGSTLMTWGYYNYNYNGTTRYGFGGPYDTRVTGVWDTWFNETITYDPTTGQGAYSINGGTPVVITGSVMPAGTTNIYLRGGAYGWYTGHTKQFDSFDVSQSELAEDQVVLSVDSEQGSPVPGNGSHVYTVGSSVTCSVDHVTSGDIYSQCVGWNGSGSVPATGSSTSVVFTINEDSALIWNWQTHYWLDVETTGNGSVNLGDDFYIEGSVQTLTAVPDEGWYFAGWSGDASGIGNATVNMDSPKSVTANFIQASVITNVAVQQVEGSRNVQISYDLAGTNQLIVSLQVYNNGTNINASSFSGDIGMVEAGIGKMIVWDAETDWNLNVAGLSFAISSEDGMPLFIPYSPGLWAVPKTQITQSYRTDRYGEDGDVQAGMEWPSPRFTDNGDGTVTDNMTGLQWCKNQGSSVTCASAMSACENMVYAGHDDWRLPNIREMRSIFSDFSRVLPAVESGIFSIYTANYYWTSTRWEYSSSYAYAVYSGNGTTYCRYYSNSSYTNPYLPVRGSSTGMVQIAKTGQSSTWSSYTTEDGDLQMGQEWPSPRFADNGDGTVTDNLTGLMWQKAFNTSRVYWDQGLYYCDLLTTGGYTDWRMPNINELETLVDYGEKYPQPTLPAGHPFTGYPTGNTEAYVWSSSTRLDNSTYKYSINFYDGRLVAYSSSGTCYYMACRGGTDFLQDLGYPSSAVAPLSQTGQTNVYHVADDGDIRAGTTDPSPRWTIDASYTNLVTDNKTGLMWYKYPYSSTAYDWYTSLNYANATVIGPYSDWRMPNIRELESLVAYGKVNPAFPDGHPFENIINEYCWSSTTMYSDNSRAYVVYMGGGWRTFIGKSTSGAAYLMLVRGSSTVVAKTGQTIPYATGDDGYYSSGSWGAEVADRFIDHGNGLVSDKLTGLTWFKDPSVVAPAKVLWADGIDICSGLNFGGFDDWRMPNQKELESLLDFGRYPALPSGHPFSIHSSYSNGDYYWSSTTYSANTTRAQAVGFGIGYIYQPIKDTVPANAYLWPVRGGN